MAAEFCYSQDLTNLTMKLAKTMSPVESAVMFTLGVSGNILALVMLVRNAAHHKWKIFYRLVGALASSDLFGILSTSPVAFAVYDNHFVWPGGQPVCDYLSFMLIFASMGTLTIVSAMSLDRYLAVWYPFFYNISQKKRRVHLMLVGVWVFAALIASMPLMNFGRNIRHFPCTWCFFDYYGTYMSDRAFSILYATLGILNTIVSSTFNCLVLYAVCRGTINTRRMSIRSARGKKREKKNEIFILIFLIAILIVHAVCWMPLMIRVLINTSGARPNYKADLLALRMASWNQILDPWLYILLRKEMLTRIYIFYRKKRYGVVFVTPASSESLSGSMRLQALNSKQRLQKMNSTESNTTTTEIKELLNTARS